MIINETPVRTSKNYGINNIEIKDFENPKRIEEFSNLTITGDAEKFKISNEVLILKQKYMETNISITFRNLTYPSFDPNNIKLELEYEGRYIEFSYPLNEPLKLTLSNTVLSFK